MNKSKLNYVINFLAFIFFLITALSGLAIKFFMLSGVRQGRLQEFLGIQKAVWLEAHNWSGIVLIILMIIHFILHWEWIVYMTKNIFKSGKCEIKEINN